VLTSLEPFTEHQITAIERFIDEHDFKGWYLPGRPARQEAVFRTLLEGTPEERERFFTDTFLNLRAPTDDRPFFFNYYKWRNLFERGGDIALVTRSPPARSCLPSSCWWRSCSRS